MSVIWGLSEIISTCFFNDVLIGIGLLNLKISLVLILCEFINNANPPKTPNVNNFFSS